MSKFGSLLLINITRMYLMFAMEILIQDQFWEEKHFIEYGCPLITSEIDTILRSNLSFFTFSPHYSVLETNLKTEESVYVFLENTTFVSLHLYGRSHPNSKNYKFNITALTLEKCIDTLNCQNLSKCSRGVICENDSCDDLDKLPDNTLYLSWKATERQTNILIQYKRNIIRCKDSEPYEIKKIVMSGTTSQNFSTAKRSVRYTTTENNTTLNFSVSSTNAVFIQASKCLDCELDFTLGCGNKIPKSSKSIYYSVSFNNSSVFKGWISTTLQHDLYDSTCNLTIETKFVDKRKVDKFWSIAFISARNVSEEIHIQSVNKSEQKQGNNVSPSVSSHSPPTGFLILILTTVNLLRY